MTDTRQALEQILAVGGNDASLMNSLEIEGQDPVLPTNFLLGTAAGATLAAVGLAAADIWELRNGSRQQITVDTRLASIALRSERYLRVDDELPEDPWGAISGVYQSKDNRWIQLHCNFPHHRDGVLAVLQCADDPTEVKVAVATWNGEDLENALAEAGMCASMLRDADEWAAHPQGKAIAQLPLFEIIKIGDSEPEPLPAGERPLSGIRALDLTRVLAGPVCGRMLAGLGADVMRIAGPHLPFIPVLIADTGLGKLSAHVDLREQSGRMALMNLVRDADIFTQGYRPGAIAGHGFSPEALAEARPGIVCVSLCAYSHAGPWQNRRGFDSLVQTASGISHEGGEDGTPGPLPAQALDHITGYLAAYGAMTALARRAREGGSWLVRLSLAQTGHWLKSLGRLNGDVDGRTLPDPAIDDVRDLLMQSDSPFGRLTHVKPPVGLSDTPMGWDRPAVPLGTHPPEWPA